MVTCIELEREPQPDPHRDWILEERSPAEVGIVLVGLPRRLARAERPAHVVLEREAERLPEIAVGSELRVDGRKKPELLLDDESADVAAEAVRVAERNGG